MFRTKRNATSGIVRYKARLVSKLYFQVVGVDFNMTFVLVAKFITIRCILALGVAMRLGDLSNGCKDGVFELSIGGGDLHGSTTIWEGTPCVQTQKNFVHTQTISKGGIPSY